MYAAPDKRIDHNRFEQHEGNEHIYLCPKCPEFFKTEAAVDQVRRPVLWLRTNRTPHLGSQHVDRKHKPPPPPPFIPPPSWLPVTGSEKSRSPDQTKSPPDNLVIPFWLWYR